MASYKVNTTLFNSKRQQKKVVQSKTYMKYINYLYQIKCKESRNHTGQSAKEL